jgi:hypothetical protein
MKIFHILLNIFLPYYSFVILTCTWTSVSIATSSFTILISSPIYPICGFIFASSSIVEITSTFSYS